MNQSELFQTWATWLLHNRSKIASWRSLPENLRDEYLIGKLGPRQANFSMSVGLTSLYSLLFLVGFFGNFLTALIILFNSYMRVSPNFFLLSLAIADMITLSGGNLTCVGYKV